MVNGHLCTCLPGNTGEVQRVMTWSMGTTVPVVPGDTGVFQHVMTWSMDTTVPVVLATLVSCFDLICCNGRFWYQ